MNQQSNKSGLTWEAWDQSKPKSEVDTQEDGHQRSTNYGAILILFSIGFLSLLASYFSLESRLKGDEAAFQVGKLGHDLVEVKALESSLQLGAILGGAVTFHDSESRVREFDPTLAAQLGTQWTAIRREALSGKVMSEQIDDLISAAQEGHKRLSFDASSWQLREDFARLTSLVTLLTGIALAIAKIRSLAEPIFIQTLVTQPREPGPAVEPKPESHGNWQYEGSRRHFEIVFSNLPIACCSFESDGRITAWNRAMEDLTGIPASQVLQSEFWNAIRWNQMNEVTKSIMYRLFQGESVEDVVWTFEHPTGERLELRAKMIPIVGPTGSTSGAVAAIEDATLQRTLEKMVIENDVVKAALYNAIPETLLRIDTFGKLVDARDNLHVFTGKVYDFVGTIFWVDGLQEGLGEAILHHARELRTGNASKIFTHGTHQDYEVRIVPCGVSDSLVLIRNGVLSPAIGAVNSELKEEIQGLRDHLAQLARLDGLTGLANHRAAREFLASQTGSVALAFIDFWAFAAYNEAAGYLAGDKLIQGVARQLAARGVEGVMLARWSGHRLAIIIPGQTIAESELVIRTYLTDLHCELKVMTAMTHSEEGFCDDLVRVANEAIRACNPPEGLAFLIRPVSQSAA